MSPQKSPAFSFYARDFLAGTSTMSLQEVGAYMRLLAYQWDAGSVPAEPEERARVMGCAKAQERDLWKRIGKKFVLSDGVYLNVRLEEERQKQTDRRQRLSDNGKRGGRPTKANGKQNESNSFPVAKANENLNESLPSSSSFPSSGIPSKNDGIPSPRPLVSGESNPRTWGKIHGEHVTGFCDWVCLPEFVFAEFCRKSGHSDKPDGGSEYVRGWAAAVRSTWSGPVGDNLKFWRARWDESHVSRTGGASIDEQIDAWASKP